MDSFPFQFCIRYTLYMFAQVLFELKSWVKLHIQDIAQVQLHRLQCEIIVDVVMFCVKRNCSVPMVLYFFLTVVDVSRFFFFK